MFPRAIAIAVAEVSANTEVSGALRHPEIGQIVGEEAAGDGRTIVRLDAAPSARANAAALLAFGVVSERDACPSAIVRLQITSLSETFPGSRLALTGSRSRVAVGSSR